MPTATAPGTCTTRPAQLTHTISALGEVSESRYDAAGRPIYSRRYLQSSEPPAPLPGFGDVVDNVVAPTATANDQRSHVVYDNDGRARFTLKATGSSGWTISENRYDANGNVIEVRRYDKFLPDARVAAIDSVGSPGITVAGDPERAHRHAGVPRRHPEHAGGRAAHTLRVRRQQPAALHGRSVRARSPRASTTRPETW